MTMTASAASQMKLCGVTRAVGWIVFSVVDWVIASKGLDIYS